MVKFIKATCPSCGGQLQIPDDLTKAFCPYCGATVILEWEGRPGPGPTAASYMKLGQAAMQAGNFEEAYDYFSKALELDSNRVQAWTGKALALLENRSPIELAKEFDSEGLQYEENTQLARGYLEIALSLDPNNVTALINLGIVSKEPKWLEKAASLDNSRRSQIAGILFAMESSLIECLAYRMESSEAVEEGAKLLEAAYRIDPTTKKRVAQEMLVCAFDMQYKKPFLGGKPYVFPVVCRQDLIVRAVELEPTLGNFVNAVSQGMRLPSEDYEPEVLAGLRDHILYRVRAQLRRSMTEYLNLHSQDT